MFRGNSVAVRFGGFLLALVVLGIPVRTAAETPAPDLDREVVARIGELTITLGEFNKLFPPDPKQPDAKVPAHAKKQRLHEMVGEALYLQAAKEQHLADDPRIKALIEQSTGKILVEEYLRRQLGQVTVSEAEMKDFYRANPSKFVVPEQRRVSHILFRVSEGAPPEAVAKTRARADAALARLRAGEKFAALASELSEDEGSRKNGGDLGLVGRGGMVKEFEDAAFALKTGGISDVVRTEFGFHILRLAEQRASYHRPFESVREFIRLHLLKQKRAIRQEQLLEELKQARNVELYPNVFDAEP